MSHLKHESMIVERVAKLRDIAERRNELLKQMYHMIKHRQDIGAILTPGIEEDGAIDGFLRDYDIERSPEGGGIAKLPTNELFAPSRPDSPPPSQYSSPPETPEPESATEDQPVGVDAPPTYSDASRPQNRPTSMHQLDLNVDLEAQTVLASPSPSQASPTGDPVDSASTDESQSKPDILKSPILPDTPPPTTSVEHEHLTSAHESLPSPEALDEPMLDPNTRMKQQEPDLGGGSTFLDQEDTPIINSPSPPPCESTTPDHQGSAQSDLLFVIATAEVKHDPSIPTLHGTPPSRVHEELVEESQPMMDKPPTFDTVHQVPFPSEADDIDIEEAPAENLSPETVNPTIERTLPQYSLFQGSRDISPGLLPLAVPAPQKRIVIPAPTSSFATPAYSFELAAPITKPSASPASPVQHRHQFNPNYTLPALKTLPVEFNRKGKSSKQRKRERERDKVDGQKNREPVKDDWYPMGLSRWVATINANPVWKRVSRASKCLSSRDWAVAMAELRLVRTLERVDNLKDTGRWSFRQPKKQRGVGGLNKTNWDYLMDEMKWMRADFREERKWKLALAYNLSTAVLEWHAFRTHAERVARGVCVNWERPPRRPETYETHEERSASSDDHMQIDEPQKAQDPPNVSSLGLDYGSEDDEDSPQSVDDPLEPASILEDALVTSTQTETVLPAAQPFRPKSEEVDDSMALHLTDQNMDVDPPKASSPPLISLGDMATPDITMEGLRPTSANPTLASTSATHNEGGDTASPTQKNTKPSLLTPLREQITYSNPMKLFLDLDDINAVRSGGPDSFDNDAIAFPDLATIFPDLQPFGLMDSPSVTPNVTSTADGKKRSERRSDRDDPTKRLEDTTYTKLYPVGKFMYTKPTLLGPLQPSKRWKNGQWLPLEENPVLPELEVVGKSSEESLNALFDGRSNSSLNSSQTQPHVRDGRKRGQDHPWSAPDDNLLKQLVDKYPYNWALISECFNASRMTIPSDRRSPLDCMEHWKERWALDPRPKPAEASVTGADGSPPPPAGQMTTRGVKRLASSSISLPGPPTLHSTGEPKKRRRHQLIQDTIRKAARKRLDLAQKMAASQRKPPAIHETHGQYSKMPKLTPAELSRMKAEKEARDMIDMQSARRRQDELTRQNHLREQAQRMQGAQAQTATQQPTQPHQPSANPPPQRPLVAPTSVGQLTQPRGQVNISQQQRIATPLNNGTARLSPQQMGHAQARHPQAPTAIPAGQPQPPNVTTTANGTGPPGMIGQTYVGRDSTSSPAHVSPPHSSATPANTANSPRTPAAQMLQPSQVPGNAVPRPTANGHFYQGFTHEQLQSALRLQIMQQAQQQTPQNGS